MDVTKTFIIKTKFHSSTNLFNNKFFVCFLNKSREFKKFIKNDKNIYIFFAFCHCVNLAPRIEKYEILLILD